MSALHVVLAIKVAFWKHLAKSSLLAYCEARAALNRGERRSQHFARMFELAEDFDYAMDRLAELDPAAPTWRLAAGRVDRNAMAAESGFDALDELTATRVREQEAAIRREAEQQRPLSARVINPTFRVKS